MSFKAFNFTRYIINQVKSKNVLELTTELNRYINNLCYRTKIQSLYKSLSEFIERW